MRRRRRYYPVEDYDPEELINLDESYDANELPISQFDDEEREALENLFYSWGELEDDYSEDSSP